MRNLHYHIYYLNTQPGEETLFEKYPEASEDHLEKEEEIGLFQALLHDSLWKNSRSRKEKIQ